MERGLIFVKIAIFVFSSRARALARCSPGAEMVWPVAFIIGRRQMLVSQAARFRMQRNFVGVLR